MKAVVIGSGIAGIASAIRLKSKGYEVIVLEANSQPGGKISELQLAGYRFDMGPSLFTLPELIDELFLLFPEHKTAFTYTRLKIICNYFWEDGKKVQAHSEPKEFANNIEKEFKTDKKKILDYLKESKNIYELTTPTFMEKSLHKTSTWLSADIIKPILSLAKLHLFNTLSEVNKNRFSDTHIQQLFNRYATYNGSSPFLTPGIMQVIPHLEFNLGAFFPKKGMNDIVNSLVQLAEEVGVEFRYNKKVKNIIVFNQSAKGVELENEVIKSDIVISNSDVHNTQKFLLKKEHFRKQSKVINRSSSAFIFYWGIKSDFKELDVHNILFSKNYQEEFKSIFEDEKIGSDPTVYIHISSKINKKDAPSNCENWFVMINTPPHNGQDWKKEKSRIKELVINKIEKVLGKTIKDKIEVEECLSPEDIEKNTGSYRGALYGTSSNSKFAAFLRHPNFSNKVKNLYHCGGSVHPGGGIPLCLHSAKIACSLIPNSNG